MAQTWNGNVLTGTIVLAADRLACRPRPGQAVQGWAGDPADLPLPDTTTRLRVTLTDCRLSGTDGLEGSATSHSPN